MKLTFNLDIKLKPCSIRPRSRLAVNRTIMDLVKSWFRIGCIEKKYVIKEVKHFKRNFFFYVSKKMSNGEIDLWAHSSTDDEKIFLGTIKNKLWYKPKNFYHLEYFVQRYGEMLGTSLSKGQAEGTVDLQEVIHRYDLNNS